MFSIEDLALAYRKAKVDVYYSSNTRLLALADYERNLQENLHNLLVRLNDVDLTWVNDPKFLGGWTVETKEIAKIPPETGMIYSSPEEEWRAKCATLANESKSPQAQFRLMAEASIDFHVLSSLWILEVGHLFDAKLEECAYGNRLRRKSNKEINRFSLGSFTPYLQPFRKWRDNGIKTMRAALDAGKKVVALTADVSSFYHELDPCFLNRNDFQDLFGICLSEEQKKLHTLFINSLTAWAALTPLKRGLPVGLPASAVVANIALIELDKAITTEVLPLYYGRYVDDIILVMENGGNFKTSRELWDWLFVRIENMDWDSTKSKIKFSPPYLTGSNIQFANEKNKVFLLAGEHGKILVDSILTQIRERASEWRSLPNLPLNAIHIGTDLVRATHNDGETVDNLRKTDSLTMRRSGFAMKLRDFEAYERDLDPATWKAHRHTFLRAFIQHVLVLPQFFALASYLPRVVKLAVACEDFDYVLKISERAKQLISDVEAVCETTIKSCPEDKNPPKEEIILRWRRKILQLLEESVVAAFPPRLSTEGKQEWLTVAPLLQQVTNIPIISSISLMNRAHAELFSMDLAHMPFRFIGLPGEMISARGIPKRDSLKYIDNCVGALPTKLLDGCAKLAKLFKLKSPCMPGLLYPVRPVSLGELYVMIDDPFSKSNIESLQSMILAARGFSLTDRVPFKDKRNILHIPDESRSERFGVAVSSWSTRHESWIAAVMRANDPDVERYARLAELVNSVLSSKSKPRYFILPELGMPARWFMRVAQKLRRSNISLITGIEYLHASKSRVRNQIWASFSHDGLGFPSTVIYQQDKQKPALHEEQELRRLNNLEMKPHRTWASPPILQHGNFRFSMLICSELTNISYRTALRGNVDALFVPEWNQDTETFNALVESAAIDIHAYIIQCNDRRYGDSRIRAPFKDSWQRDVLRVKGGTSDYSITGEIDVISLRQFQSSFRSASKPYKPVPDGFVINYHRKALPHGE